MYIGMHILFCSGVAWYLYRVIKKPFTSISPYLAVVIILLYEYEIYREILRLCGLYPVMSQWRDCYLNIVYLATGLLLREVVFYAEKVLEFH